VQQVEIQAKEVRLVPIGEIKPNPTNRNKHSQEQIDRLAEIIKYQGFRSPIVVSNQTGMVVMGHGRILAAKKLGIKEVPVIFQDFDSPKQEYAAQVSDNAIASWAELDLSGINADLGDLGPDFDLDLLGIKNFTLDVAEKEGLTDPDEIPEHVEPRTKLGDLYRLGNHRLLCGDSTSIDAVERLMDGERADMVFTDPPYGISYKGSNNGIKVGGPSVYGREYRPIEGDDAPFEPGFLLSFFEECKEIFLWGADYYIGPELMRSGGLLVWDKRIGKQDLLPGSHFEICWSKHKHGRKILRHGWVGCSATERGEKRVHPTQKSVVMICDIFENIVTNKSKIVVDIYGGSGSTLIACEKTNRNCYMMELDPKYCDVIVARWEAFTGQKAELING
jgi:DNA modification methylase